MEIDDIKSTLVELGMYDSMGVSVGDTLAAISVATQDISSITERIEQYLSNGNSRGSSITGVDDDDESTSRTFDVVKEYYKPVREGVKNIVDMLSKMDGGMSHESFKDELNRRAYDKLDPEVQQQLLVLRGQSYEDEIRTKSARLEGRYDAYGSKEKYYEHLKKEEKKNAKTEKFNNSIKGKLTKGAFDAIGGIKSIGEGESKGATGKVIGGVGNAVGNAIGDMIGGPYGMIVKAVVSAVKAMFDMWSEMEKKAQEYARTIGGGREAMADILQLSDKLAMDQNLSLNFGIQQEKIIEKITEYQKELGVRVAETNKGWADGVIMMEKLGVSAKSLASLDNLGVDMERASYLYGEVYSAASKHGVAFSKVSENINNNIRLASQYTFKQAVGELSAMAEKSAAISWDMQQTAQFAEKVNNVEGAAKTAAQLSVLGGQFSQIANPLALLHDSLNDFENLDDKLVKLFGSFGKYNQQTHQVDVDKFDRERIRAASSAMGVDYAKAMETVNRQAIRKEVENQLLGNSNGLDDDSKTFIKNTARIDEFGHAYVNIRRKDEEGNTSMQKVDIKDLTQSDKQELQRENELASLDTAEQIAETTKTLDDEVQGIFGFLTGWLKSFMIGKWGEGDEALAEQDKKNILEDTSRVGEGATQISESDAQKYADEWAKKGRWHRAWHSESDYARARKWEDTYGYDERVKDIMSNDLYDSYTKKYRAMKKIVEENGLTPQSAQMQKKGMYVPDNAKYASGLVPEWYQIGNYAKKYVGNSHAMGGIKTKYGDKGYLEAEGDEWMISKPMASRFTAPLLDIANGTFGQKWSNIGNPLNPMMINPVSAIANAMVDFGKINGKIELTGGGSSKEIDISSLFNNPVFKNKLVEMIGQSLNMRSHAGRYNKKEDVNRSVYNA